MSTSPELVCSTFTRLQQYSQYVESLCAQGAEEAPGCETCAANRMMLEKAWQVRGAQFSQQEHAADITGNHQVVLNRLPGALLHVMCSHFEHTGGNKPVEALSLSQALYVKYHLLLSESFHGFHLLADCCH